MLLLTKILVYSAVFVVQCSCYLFNINYSYVFPANGSGYSVFLQKSDDGFRLVAGAAKVDRLVFCYNSTYCQPFTLSQRNQAGYELFGAAIDGGDETGDPLYICSPRFISVTQKSNQYRVNGRCFVLNGGNFKAIYSLSQVYSQVLSFNGTNQYFFAHGQVGFSVKYIDKKNFLVGAPGVLSWKGTIVKHTTYDSKIVLNPDRKLEINSYLGYTIEYANFHFGRRKRSCIIAGAPRGDYLLGQVFIFDYDYVQDITIKILKGDQLGSYFGSSLLATTDELFVGAPMYTTKTYEEGCVYVFKNDMLDLLLAQKLCGSHIAGRFGTAITKIGFIGLNKNLGIAISAPYADGGVGIVYVYVKDDDGYKEIQQVSGKTVSGFTRGFGLSLSNAVDTDRNRYNDFAIGSLDSDYLIILRSRKILRFQAYIRAYVDRIDANMNNFSIGYCFTYMGRSNDSDSIKVNIHIETDNRVTMVGGNKTLQTEIGSQKCEDLDLVLKAHAFDSPLPLKIKIINGLEECDSCPVVFPKNTTITHEIPFVTGCGDNICTPNLTLEAKFENISQLVLGSRDTVTLTVLVTNFGETAYLCKMNMSLPTEISQFPAACSKTDNILNCDISNRVVINQKKQLQFQFDVKHLDVKLTKLKVDISVNSAGSGNGSHVESSIALPIILKSKVALLGFSNPDYLDSADTVSFVHEYLIFNSGPSPLTEKTFEFQIPEGVVTSNDGVVYPFIINPVADECIPRDIFDEPVRRKRDTGDLEQILSDLPPHMKYFLGCTNPSIKCKLYRCEIGELTRNSSLKFKFNIDVTTPLLFSALRDDVKEKSFFLIESVMTSLQSSMTQKVSTYTVLRKKKIEIENMWMWILIAVLSSLVILAIIIGILYKVNFFSRPMREKLLNEEEHKHERECFMENEENITDGPVEMFREIHF